MNLVTDPQQVTRMTPELAPHTPSFQIKAMQEPNLDRFECGSAPSTWRIKFLYRLHIFIPPCPAKFPCRHCRFRLAPSRYAGSGHRMGEKKVCCDPTPGLGENY
ncbi:hypothetical protein TNCV_1391211 [Trichonephila clavipes]|nr:hypothetical protein TNCV_1391211 [Trichonephila clavipes]